MFRSGRLTAARVNQIIGWVEKLPHNLKAVAKACNIYPSDLMAWYAAGQDPACKDPLMAELAWRVAEIRGRKAAENYARIEVLATEGDFKAVEKLEEMSEASAWEISPDAEQATELHRMMAELVPTPLLSAGVLEHGGELPSAVAPLDGPLAGGDGGGQIELPNRGGQVAVNDLGAPEVEGGGGVDGLQADQKIGVQVRVDGEFDGVAHSQSVKPPE